MMALPTLRLRNAVSGWALLLFFLVASVSGRGEEVPRLREVTAEALSGDGDSPPWGYVLYLPDSYPDSETRWPLLLWLHGRSLRGEDLARLRRYGPPSFLGKRSDFPFVVVCPQLRGGAWQPESLVRLLDECLQRYRVDPDRVVLSGVSLGAMGAWALATAQPARFAALVPVCAHGPASAAERLLDLPIRAYHGDADEIVPIGPHRSLVDSIREKGGQAELIVLPGGTHGSVIAPVYADPELYQWMLRQRRTGP